MPEITTAQTRLWELRSHCIVIVISSSPLAGDIKLEEIIRWLLMPKDPPAILKSVSVNLPFGMGGATWKADPTEQNAAWELYIDLVTRIAVQPLRCAARHRARSPESA